MPIGKTFIQILGPKEQFPNHPYPTIFLQKQNDPNKTVFGFSDGNGNVFSSFLILEKGPGPGNKLSKIFDVDISTPSEGDSLIYDSTTEKWINEAGGHGTTGEYLSLSGGSLYGNLTMSSTTVVKSSNGGGQIDLDYGGSSGEIFISNDNGGGENSYLYLSDGAIALSVFDLDSNDNKIEINSSLTRIARNTQESSIIIQTNGKNGPAGDIVFEVLANDGTYGSENFKIADNSSSETTSDETDKLSVFIATKNSSFDSEVFNSVIIGGDSIVATTSNTVFVPDLEIQSEKVIRSANGGGQIDLDYGGSSGEIFISNDNGGGENSYLYLSEGSISLSVDLNSSGVDVSSSNTQIYRITPDTSIELSTFGDGSLPAGAITLSVVSDNTGAGYGSENLKIADNSSASTTSDGASDKLGVFIATKGSQFNSGVFNSVIVGGSEITADISDSLYAQNARLAENGGVIYSGGTDLYSIFGTGSVNKYSTTLTTPSGGTYTITHSLGTTDISVSLWFESTGNLITEKVSNRTINTVDVVFSVTMSGDVRVVVQG